MNTPPAADREGRSGEQPLEVETSDRAAEQLRAVLALAADGVLRCSPKTRRPSSVTIRLLADALPGGDFYIDAAISSYAWPLLIQAGGLVDGSRLALTPRGRAAQKKEPAEVLRRLWQRWLKNGIIDEFSRVEAVKGQRATNVLSALGYRRLLVAEALLLHPVGEWVEVDDFFARMQDEGFDPVVHRNERSLWKLYLQDPQYGSFGYDGAHAWELLQGRYVLAVLFEYAATLGLIDVRYTDPELARPDFQAHWGGEDIAYLSRYDGLRAVRVNALGAYCLGMDTGPHGG